MIKAIICHSCGSKDFYTKPVGPHLGAYCKKCNKWIKWLAKTEFICMDDTPMPKEPISPVSEEQIKNCIENSQIITLDNEEVPW